MCYRFEARHAVIMVDVTVMELKQDSYWPLVLSGGWTEVLKSSVCVFAFERFLVSALVVTHSLLYSFDFVRHRVNFSAISRICWHLVKVS